MAVFTEISKSSYDPNNPNHKTDKDMQGREIFIEKKHEGRVVATGEHNYHNDSDFYAVVYDQKTDSFFECEFGTTRHYTYNNGATIDAPKHLIDLYIERERQASIEREREYYRKKRLTVGRDKTVKVVKGKKVPVGTTGKVTWIGFDNYRKGEYRIGIIDDQGKTHYTSASNVIVTHDSSGNPVE